MGKKIRYGMGTVRSAVVSSSNLKSVRYAHHIEVETKKGLSTLLGFLEDRDSDDVDLSASQGDLITPAAKGFAFLGSEVYINSAIFLDSMGLGFLGSEAHRREEKELEIGDMSITFHYGSATYYYFDVPLHRYISLVNAGSPGRYHHNHFKGFYGERKSGRTVQERDLG